MTFSWDFNTATLLTIATEAVVVIIFLVRSDTRSKSAKDIASAAQKRADEAHDKISVQTSTHSLFREEVAREYVSHVSLQQMETRLTHSIDGIRQRLDKVLDSRQVK